MDTTTLGIIDTSPFWISFLASFWSQLLATLIIVLIGSVIIPRIVRWSQRAKLKFYAAGSNRGTKFHFTQSSNGDWDVILHLTVRNEGTKTIERFYWEMYLPKDVSISLDEIPPYPRYYTTDEKIEGDYVHRYGYIEMPIFPLDQIPFVHVLKLRTKTRKDLHIYYYFRTDLGEYPIWSWFAISRRKYSWLKHIIVN